MDNEVRGERLGGAVAIGPSDILLDDRVAVKDYKFGPG